MPTPNDGESREDFVARCIPIVLKDGTAKDQEQAAAVCFSMWRQEHGGEPPKKNTLKAIQKDADELRVANYIALFGGRDLEGIASPRVNADGTRGEYFTPDTDFESDYTKTGRLYVDWEHGLENADDPVAPSKDDIFGFVDWKTARKDDYGLWVERVLNRRQKYMKYIEALIEEGLIGTSTEPVQGAVKKGTDGRIEIWPLRRDTLTVNPMEPRMMSANAITAIKALAEVQPSLKALLPEDVVSIDGGATAERERSPQVVIISEEKKKMDEKELTKEQVLELARKHGIVKPPDEIAEHPVVQALQKSTQAVQDQLNQTLEMLSKSPVLKDAGYIAPESEEDHADAKSFGDFLVSVRLGNKKRLAKVYGSSYQDWGTDGLPDHQKVALAEGSGTTGGYLVPTEFGGPIELRANQRVILRVAGAPVETMTSRSKELWLGDVETAPSAGSSAFAHGVVGYWISEAGSITESEPRFRLVELVAHKLAAFSLASSEVRDDARASVDGLLGKAFSEELASQENYAHFRGDGVGKPLGILNSSAWNAGNRSAASTIALADLATMEGNFLGDADEGIYVVNTAAFKELVELVSNPLAFLNSMREQIPMTLLGRQLFRFGGLPALNTAGDIMLVNPQYYIIGERSGLQIAFSEHFKFQNDQLAWRVTRRIDGQPAVNAGVTLENASTVVYPFSGLAAG